MDSHPSNLPKVQEKTTTFALPLRAIGQALEALHIEAFDMEKEGDDYIVRCKSKDSAFELRYTPEDVDRLEREGQARRHNPNGMADGHSMAELLRAAGDYVDWKDGRLLGISWQVQSVSIVYETVQGRRKLDVLTIPSMYDFWLAMFLRRTVCNS